MQNTKIEVSESFAVLYQLPDTVSSCLYHCSHLQLGMHVVKTMQNCRVYVYNWLVPWGIATNLCSSRICKVNSSSYAYYTICTRKLSGKQNSWKLHTATTCLLMNKLDCVKWNGAGTNDCGLQSTNSSVKWTSSICLLEDLLDNSNRPKTQGCGPFHLTPPN